MTYVLVGTGLSLALVSLVLALGARDLTDTYEQRHGLQAFALLLALGAIWALVWAAARAS